MKKVQEELRPFGLGMKVFDAYRPQMAVDHFVRWAHDLKDTRMKQEFYPDVEKKKSVPGRLYRGKIGPQPRQHRGPDHRVAGRVKTRSGNWTWAAASTSSGLRSWPDSQLVPAPSRAHRLLLRLVMEKHGFKPYPQEWWHFTLNNEPWPETYFTFPVQ